MVLSCAVLFGLLWFVVVCWFFCEVGLWPGLVFGSGGCFDGAVVFAGRFN